MSETWYLVLFAGGPGLAALVVQAWKWRGERPLRDANAAEVLTNTATGLLDRMQERIDHLESALGDAESRIVELEARLDEARTYSEEVGRLRGELESVKHENVRLRSMLPERIDDPHGTTP